MAQAGEQADEHQQLDHCLDRVQTLHILHQSCAGFTDKLNTFFLHSFKPTLFAACVRLVRLQPNVSAVEVFFSIGSVLKSFFGGKMFQCPHPNYRPSKCRQS
jgi:Flp pilus assembly protein TadB